MLLIENVGVLIEKVSLDVILKVLYKLRVRNGGGETICLWVYMRPFSRNDVIHFDCKFRYLINRIRYCSFCLQINELGKIIKNYFNNWDTITSKFRSRELDIFNFNITTLSKFGISNVDEASIVFNNINILLIEKHANRTWRRMKIWNDDYREQLASFGRGKICVYCLMVNITCSKRKLITNNLQWCAMFLVLTHLNA